MTDIHVPGVLDSYEFQTPGRIVFGWGRRTQLATIVAGWGDRAFVVCGSRTLQGSGALDQLIADLQKSGSTVEVFQAPARETEVADVDDLVREWLDRGVGPNSGHFVVAIGGGSAIDLAKAAAALVTNSQGESVRKFLEGVGSGRTITLPPLPLIALPTTSGTGSEATRNAVISSYDPPFKKSLRSPLMLPKAVLVDPELTVSLSPQITAWTGLDALTQLLESLISRRAQPIPSALALQGLEGFVPALRTAYREPTNRAARERLAHGALLSGIALANSGLGLAHGVAAGLGVLYRVPHGLACATMLPIALRENAPVCEAVLARACSVLTGRAWALPRDAITAGCDLFDELLDELQVPRRLSQLGVTAAGLPALAKASRGNSLDGNPRTLTEAELLSILESQL